MGVVPSNMISSKARKALLGQVDDVDEVEDQPVAAKRAPSKAATARKAATSKQPRSTSRRR